MKTLFKLLAGCLFCTAVCTACGKDKDTVAVIGDESITANQFEAYLKLKNIPKTDEEKVSVALDDLVEREALAQAIEKQKLLDKVRIDAEIAEFRRQMLIGRYFEKYLDDKVSEQAIRNDYNSHAEDYQETQVNVAHILLRTNRKMSDAERAAKRTQAHEVYSKLEAGGDFEQLAAEYSEDKVSARKGGKLGWVKEGGVDPVFSKKIFSMEPGTTSEPFETAFGYHIVRILEEPKVIKKPLRAVEGDIRYELRSKAKKAAMERLKNSIKTEKGKYRVESD